MRSDIIKRAGERGRGPKGLTVLDAVITLCLIGVLIGVVIPRYERIAQAAREAALRTGLTNIRTSIKLFQILNKRNPASLRELLETKVLLPVHEYPAGAEFLNQYYLMHLALDERGNPVDPFGDPFVYDPVRGEVRSATKGYETW